MITVVKLHIIWQITPITLKNVMRDFYFVWHRYGLLS